MYYKEYCTVVNTFSYAIPSSSASENEITDFTEWDDTDVDYHWCSKSPNHQPSKQ